MRRDHRPYFIKKYKLRFEDWYVKHFLAPQFKHLGKGYTFFKPWHVEVFGEPVIVGNYANVIATKDQKVRLTIWSEKDDIEGIIIGDYCLICPGVRISSARNINIGNSCMLASSVYITDADWHGIYDRSLPVGKAKSVNIGDNVWIGDSAIICKGVTIGDNSIIGAGAVVTSDIPPNSIAAGNPAMVIKELDNNEELKTRAHWFSDYDDLQLRIDKLDREKLAGNTVFDWLRSLVLPRKGD